jgi:hypothetical protein
MPQQQSLQVLARLAQHPDRCGACSDQIPHRLMGCIRNPNSGQLTCSVQLRQHHRVSPIRLDAIAGFHRNQRGRHDRAFTAKICNLPMQPITARAGFVAEPQSLNASLAEALDKLADLIGAVQKIAEMAHLPAAFP